MISHLRMIRIQALVLLVLSQWAALFQASTQFPTPSVSPPEYGLRLVGGNWPGEGRVEINYRGTWGTVCDDSWDLRDAQVVCRQLGYPSAARALSSAHFGRGSGRIWLDDVECQGSESSLGICRHRPWGVHNCGHHEDASVICSAPPQEEFLLFADATRGKIMKVSPDDPGSLRPLNLSSAIRRPVAIDYDSVEDRVYWTDVTRRTISRSFLNGSMFEVLFSRNVRTPDGLAVDPVGRNLYWTDTGTKKLEVSKVDGSYRKALITTNIDKPRDIILDVSKGIMYWTDWGSRPKIEKADMSGFNNRRFVLVSSSLRWPNGLTLDQENNRLYWVDASFDKLEYLHVITKRRVTLISSSAVLPHPFGLTLLGDYLYWTDWNRNAVYRANKENAGNVTAFVRGIGEPMDIHGYNLGEITRPVTNQCSYNNGGCGHLCLLSPNGRVCACGSGYILNSDQRTCRALSTSPTPNAISPSPASTQFPTSSVSLPEYGLRLVGGNWSGEGRVEINYRGTWGTVCDDLWDLRDARVVCRQLGYPSAVRALSSAHFGRGSGRIWLDDVQCQGNETSLGICQHRPWGVHNCGHSEDASVICSPMPTPTRPRFAFTISCYPSAMVVHIARDSLPLGSDASLLRLNDPSCGVNYVTEKSVIIKAPLIGCGTVRRNIGYKVSFHNKVVVPFGYGNKRSLSVFPFKCVYSHFGLP